MQGPATVQSSLSEGSLAASFVQLRQFSDEPQTTYLRLLAQAVELFSSWVATEAFDYRKHI